MNKVTSILPVAACFDCVQNLGTGLCNLPTKGSEHSSYLDNGPKKGKGQALRQSSALANSDLLLLVGHVNHAKLPEN